MTNIAIEMTVATDSAGTLRTLYVSQGALVTGPAATPPHTAFLARVTQPALLRLDLFEPGGAGGASRVNVGEIVLANPDGALDEWIAWGFSGRAAIIRSGDDAAAYPAAWLKVLTLAMDQPEFDEGQVRIRVRDRQSELDVSAHPASYGGTNALPGGVDGGADLAGTTKPRAWGVCKNIAPVCVNTARFIYQAHDGGLVSVDGVYDRGGALTAGTAYSSEADMQANAPAAGQYRAWLGGGMIRLGSRPSGQLTADVTAGTGTAARAGSIMQALAVAAGIASGDIVAADVAALDAAAPYTLGLYLPAGDTTTARAAMDRVCSGLAAWFGFDGAGRLRMGQLTTPAGASPAVYIAAHQIRSLKRRALTGAGALPAWRCAVRYGVNNTVQTSDLVASVTADRQAWLSVADRVSVVTDAAVKVQHLLAADLEVASVIDAKADADTEAARQLALYKVRRDAFDVVTQLPDSALALLEPGCAVSVTWPRWGLAAGRVLRVIGVQINRATRTATLTVWG